MDRIIFKGKKDEIIIVLDENTEFNELRDIFKKKVSESKDFFKNATSAVSFQGKSISEKETHELLKILLDMTGLKMIAPPVRNKSYAVEKIRYEAKEVGERVYFHKGSLRSGQAVNFQGNVVVTGDINPGAEIIAEGNIIVLGAIKGMVHAGSGGDTSCFVAALKFLPTQLRIADTISYIPPEVSKKSKTGATQAYIENGQIYIAPL